MKPIYKLSMIVCILCALAVGCTTVNIRPGQNEALQDLAIKISARQLGYRLGQNNPARIDEFIEYSDAFGQAEADPVKLFVALLDKLQIQVNTYPMLEADLRDLLKALDFQVDINSVLTERHKAMIYLGIAAFREGLTYAKPKEGS